MRKSLFTVLVFVRVNTRRFFRDPLAIFFSVVFPLIFLFVFGSFNSGNSAPSFHVALINESQSPFAKNFVEQTKKGGFFKVDDSVTTIDKAKELMTKSQLDGAIVLPGDFGTVKSGQQLPTGEAQVLYTQNNTQSGAAIVTGMQSAFKSINDQLVHAPSPFTVKTVELKQKSLSAFDYTFAGLLGFSIIGMGIFGPMNVFPELKKMGILRRLSTTPLRVWQYFMSTMIGQAIIGLLALSTMFVFAILVFHLRIVGNWLELILFLIFGIITILGIGLALGGWAKNERQAAPLSNIIVFPMMFLSGTFFPRFLMPEWLQTVSALLPLTPIIDGIRLIATEGKHLWEITPQLGLMTIWCIIIYVIAFRVFRWE